LPFGAAGNFDASTTTPPTVPEAAHSGTTQPTTTEGVPHRPQSNAIDGDYAARLAASELENLQGEATILQCQGQVSQGEAHKATATCISTPEDPPPPENGLAFLRSELGRKGLCEKDPLSEKSVLSKSRDCFEDVAESAWSFDKIILDCVEHGLKEKVNGAQAYIQALVEELSKKNDILASDDGVREAVNNFLDDIEDSLEAVKKKRAAVPVLTARP
jgi:hypothetical protein